MILNYGSILRRVIPGTGDVLCSFLLQTLCSPYDIFQDPRMRRKNRRATFTEINSLSNIILISYSQYNEAALLYPFL